MNFVYYDGAFLPENEARIPVTDRGFLFGDGAYATIQVRDGSALYLETHLLRLDQQCRSFGLQMPPLSASLVDELIRINRATEGIWRLKVIISGGDDPAYHLPERMGRALITIKPYVHPPYSLPLRVGIFPHPLNLCHASFKSLAHLNRFYVMEEARRQKVDDCLTLTEKGIVLELAFGNLFWLVHKTLFTPRPTLPLYFGVTITHIIEEAKKEGYQIEEVEMRCEDLPDEGTYFRTSSMGGVLPIGEIGGKQKGAHFERPFFVNCLHEIG